MNGNGNIISLLSGLWVALPEPVVTSGAGGSPLLLVCWPRSGDSGRPSFGVQPVVCECVASLAFPRRTLVRSPLSSTEVAGV